MYLPSVLLTALVDLLLEILLNIPLCLPEPILLAHHVLHLQAHLLKLLPLFLAFLQHLQAIEELSHLLADLLPFLTLYFVELEGLQELGFPLGGIFGQLVGLQSQLLNLLLELGVL